MNQKEARQLNRVQFHVNFGETTKIYIATFRPRSNEVEAVLTPVGWSDEFAEHDEILDDPAISLTLKESMELRELVKKFINRITG